MDISSALHRFQTHVASLRAETFGASSATASEDDIRADKEKLTKLMGHLAAFVDAVTEDLGGDEQIGGYLADALSECIGSALNRVEPVYEDPNAEHRLGKVHYGIGG